MTVLVFPPICDACRKPIRDKGDLRAISVVNDGKHYHAACWPLYLAGREL